MTLVLRIIRKSSWYTEGHPWLPNNALPADPVTDLRTIDNSLSVWEIDEDRSNLQRIVTALAGNRDRIEKIDCVIFAKRTIADVSIKTKKSKGGTSDEGVNGWHLDLVEISAKKLLSLAKTIYDQGERKRILGKKIEELLGDGIKSGQIDPAKLRLKPEHKAKLGIP